MAIIAVLALCWQIIQSNRQSRMQSFLIYTQRYQDILINLPIGVESKNFTLDKDEKEREHMLRWLRAYFDLCSEEYHLHKTGLIQKKVWNLWEAGMKDSLQKPAFVEAWKEIQANNYYNKKFSNFIAGLIQNNK